MELMLHIPIGPRSAFMPGLCTPDLGVQDNSSLAEISVVWGLTTSMLITVFRVSSMRDSIGVECSS